MSNQQSFSHMELTENQNKILHFHFSILSKEHRELVCQLSRHRKILNEISKICNSQGKTDIASIKEYVEFILKEKPVRTVSELREIEWDIVDNLSP